MRKIRNITNKMVIEVMLRGAKVKGKVIDVFTQKEGEGFVDTALFS